MNYSWKHEYRDAAGLAVAFLCVFFQAEDGIRDWSVTGVQTCALPICLSVKVVEIDGSYRKTRLLRHRTERVPVANDDERAVTIAAAITAAMKSGKISGDMVLDRKSVV